jgi:predicted CopG family antitoxin
MKLKFTYDKKEDIWCLLNKGKSSNNSPNPTKAYEQLVEFAGENPNENSTSEFIDKYISEKNINIDELIKKYQEESNKILGEYQRIAENIFRVSLKKDITAYLTINTRCPYRIKENMFFVSVSNINFIKTIMHELWHFYTWYKFGKDVQQTIGNKKYNDVKESLTVLLNVECRHLLHEGDCDTGYLQHKQLRGEILKLWKQNPNIDFVWDEITKAKYK